MTTTFEQAEILKKSEYITDDDGIERPVFSIAGSKVAFRTRQEVPSFTEGGQKYHIASPLDAVPITLERDDNPPNFIQFSEASQDILGVGVIEMVTATPEGLVGAAIEMGTTDKGLLDIQASLKSGEYSSDTIQLIDTIAAALNFGDDGEKLIDMETNGLSLVLASLMGDEQASDDLVRRRESMYDFFDAQKKLKLSESKVLPEIYDTIESIDPRNVVLVHSTAHAITRAADGSVKLYPSSAFREDKFPRASIHFTPNEQVSSHYAGAWGSENSLIVSNFEEVVRINDELPAAMSSADTFFTLDPGRGLELPDARIVKADFSDTEELIRQDGDVITYKDSADYTEQEKADILQLAREYRVTSSRSDIDLSDVLREVALRTAMKQKGADWFVEIGAHYAEDEQFQSKYTKLASELGSRVTLHVYTGDAHAEEAAAIGMAGQFSKKTKTDDAYRTFWPDTSLQTVRQVIASGYIPARPHASSVDKSTESDLGFF